MKATVAAGMVMLLGLGACGGGASGTIAKLDRTMMIFIEPPIHTGDEAEAVVHYILAAPQALDSRERVVRMKYRSAFDCAKRGVADRAQTFTLESGQTITNEFAQATFETPTAGTVREGIWESVCDPAKAKKLRAGYADVGKAEARYREMLADGKL